MEDMSWRWRSIRIWLMVSNAAMMHLCTQQYIISSWKLSVIFRVTYTSRT